MRAGEAGIGIVGIPDYMTVLSKRLVRILPNVRGEEFDLFFVYPTELTGICARESLSRVFDKCDEGLAKVLIFC